MILLLAAAIQARMRLGQVKFRGCPGYFRMSANDPITPGHPALHPSSLPHSEDSLQSHTLTCSASCANTWSVLSGGMKNPMQYEAERMRRAFKRILITSSRKLASVCFAVAPLPVFSPFRMTVSSLAAATVGV